MRVLGSGYKVKALTLGNIVNAANEYLLLRRERRRPILYGP